MKNQRVLGLDLGKAAYKLITLELRGAKPPLLTRARLVEIPHEADDADRKDALKKLLQGIRLADYQDVVSLIDDPFICVHQVLTPPMPPAELPGAVRWELQRYLALPPEDVSVDYQLIGETEQDGSKKFRMLGAAVPTATIQDHLKLLAELGVNPTQIVPEESALASWHTGFGKPVASAPFAVLLFGGTTSEFLVIQESQILFTRRIPVSSRDITKGMTGILMTPQGPISLDEEKAEKVKREIGIPASAMPEPSAGGISGTQLLSLIRASLERLAAELERSLTFYGESTTGVGIGELVLVGGGAQLKGLNRWLQNRLGLNVTVPDPLQGIEQGPGAMEGAAANAALSFVPVIGAAANAGSGLNLLPASIKVASQVKFKRAVATGLLTLVLIGAISVRVGMGAYQGLLRTKLNSLKMEQAASAQEFARAKTADAAYGTLLMEPYWEDVFKSLSQCTLGEIYLLSLNIEEGREVVLHGRVHEQAGKTSDVILTEFIKKLEEDCFARVRLVSSRQIDPTVQESDFEIRCVLK